LINKCSAGGIQNKRNTAVDILLFITTRVLECVWRLDGVERCRVEVWLYKAL